jgi:hypothetical protein
MKNGYGQRCFWLMGNYVKHVWATVSFNIGRQLFHLLDDHMFVLMASCIYNKCRQCYTSLTTMFYNGIRCQIFVDVYSNIRLNIGNVSHISSFEGKH